MPAPRQVSLMVAQIAELTAARDHHPKPYVRERAAALLKGAAGQSIRAVARTGLLRPHRADTVAAWIDRYLAEGLAGLLIRPGRGRKPAFSPLAPAGASRQLRDVLQRAPRGFVLERSRWRLADLGHVLP